MIGTGATELEHLAGSVLIAGFDGVTAPGWLVDSARRGEVGGAILFRRNVTSAGQVAELLAALGGAFPSSEPPILAVDQEGGRVARLGPPIVTLPPMRRLGAIDDPKLTERAGHLLGRQLASLGFTCNFAPVLDVDTNPKNPVIGDRSFGADPDLVVRQGLAFAHGLARAGLVACGKHFPGHGDTELDSHLALPKLAHDRTRLDAVELAPFRAARGELASLMTAHVVFEALDPDRPGTLSPAVVTGLLREELGYDGLIVSDDLEMAAVREGWGIGESARLAIAAGCDALLVCSSEAWVGETREALATAAGKDPTFHARLADATSRTLATRRAHPPRPAADPVGFVHRLQEVEGEALQNELANRT